jgi:hypothetical protein
VLWLEERQREIRDPPADLSESPVSSTFSGDTAPHGSSIRRTLCLEGSGVSAPHKPAKAHAYRFFLDLPASDRSLGCLPPPFSGT